MKKHTFDLLLSGIPYQVTTESFAYNAETRFKVSYNNGPENIFAWDEEMQQYKSIDDENTDMPDDLEQAISAKLEEQAPAE